MSRNCIACGKHIGMLGVKIQLLTNEDTVVCGECFEKMPHMIDNVYRGRVSAEQNELTTMKEEVIHQLKDSDYNQDTIDLVKRFFDTKIEDDNESENGKEKNSLKKCPVCKNKVGHDTEICSACGYDFNPVSAVEYKEIARIYNNRHEQYMDNPFYEYDYIVVPNKADGTTDKEHIKEILNSHAMQGWRLVTMYSNEISKNVTNGTTLTNCEDVLVFERCIKGVE